MLRCDQLTEVATDYLEGGDLSLSERGEIFLHLRCCRDCRTYLSQIRAIIRLLRELPAPSPSPAISDALIAYFRRAQAAPVRNSSQPSAKHTAID